jgi:hypothetical protein
MRHQDPEGLTRAIEEVFDRYESEALSNQVVALDDWYDWLHE